MLIQPFSLHQEDCHHVIHETLHVHDREVSVDDSSGRVVGPLSFPALHLCILDTARERQK
jgi:hypothetical protein